MFDPEKVRVLVPTAGGPNALGAARLALAIARKSATPVSVLYVEREASWWQNVVLWFRPNPAGQGLDQHYAELKGLANGAQMPEMRRVQARDVGRAIVLEARRDYDLVVIGATRREGQLGGRILEDVVTSAPCHVAVIRGGGQAPFRHLLVPIDGSGASRVAAELAARVAEMAGAQLTLAILTEHRPQVAAYSDETGSGEELVAAPVPEEEINRVSAVFKTWEKKPHVLRFA
jgi:nucleotide-binding universal stress UspA family protein